jgi:branched-subunit amino acid aminotransferase/4-amino-4-deoxychorismate lyase
MNYLNNILARIEASRAGCDEALMLNMDGITRAVVIDVAAQAGIRC